jgi:hemerythrin-like domain-containing protein
MSKVIEKLQKEHFRLGRVVCLLNDQSNLRTDATAPNIALLVDALCYLTRFPDVTHHVLEDRMVERAAGKEGARSRVRARNRGTTYDVDPGWTRFAAGSGGGNPGENMSQELVDIRVQLYAERLRHNMAIEELTLFPAARKSLNEEDWHAIEDIPGLHAQSDPLFDGEVGEQFAQLYRAIKDEASTARADPFLSWVLQRNA